MNILHIDYYSEPQDNSSLLYQLYPLLDTILADHYMVQYMIHSYRKKKLPGELFDC